MASLRFRDRFFTPQVARATTAPSSIVALGAGAAVGIVATAGLAGPLFLVGGVVGGALGYAGRIAAAIPRGSNDEPIVPQRVDEPWRGAINDARHARERYRSAIGRVRTGPLRDALTTISDDLDHAVQECWEVAKQGQILSEARAQLDDGQTQAELQQIRASVEPGATPSPVVAQTIGSLEAQLATASRIDRRIRSAHEQLGLLNARLDETVNQAIELSISNRSGTMEPVGAKVGEIVDSLTALREAMVSLDAEAEPPFPQGHPAPKAEGS